MKLLFSFGESSVSRLPFLFFCKRASELQSLGYMFNYATAAAFDALVFGLTLYGAYRIKTADGPTSSLSRLVKVLVRDGKYETPL